MGPGPRTCTKGIVSGDPEGRLPGQVARPNETLS
jgi:hypothetical protein